MKWLCLSLSLTCATAFAAPKTPADYATLIAKAFARFKTPDDAVELLKFYTPEGERGALTDYLRKHPFTVLPAVKAKGSELQFNFSGRILNLQVVDGAKNLFAIDGVEIDLSTHRPLAARLQQIAALTAPETASFWQILLPRAEAQADDDTAPIPVATAGVVIEEATEYETVVNAGGSAFNIYFLCHQLVQNPKSIPSNAFSDKTWHAVRAKRFAKNPVPPETSNWEGPALGYLEKVKPKYCKSGTWHSFKKNFVPFEETAGAQDETCKQIKKTIECLKKLEDKKGSRLYKEQRDEVTKWLKDIVPEGGKAAATQLANETGVSGTSAASK